MYFIRDKSKYKPFEKKFSIKKYLNKTLLYSKDEEKYNVFEINFIDKIINKSNIIIKYQKKNLPVVNFPSTNNLNEELLINRITFKVTNRIYINFELSKKEIINNDSKEFKIFRRIYINFNNDKNKNIVEVNINDDTVDYFKLINLIYVHNMMNIKNIIINKSIIKKNNSIDGTLSDNVNLNYIIKNNNEKNNENNNENYIKDEYFEERVLEIIKKYDESKEDKVTILEYILYQFFKFITIFSLVLYISKCFAQKENKEENEYNNFMFWKK